MELKVFYSDALKVISRGILKWDGHAWRNRNALLRAIIEQNPAGKIPLGRTGREDFAKKDVEQLTGDAYWRNLALDRERERERWKLVQNHFLASYVPTYV